MGRIMENIILGFCCDSCLLCYEEGQICFKEGDCNFCESCADSIIKSPEQEILYLKEKLDNAQVALSNIQAASSVLDGPEKPNYAALRDASVKVIGLEKKLKDMWKDILDLMIKKQRELKKDIIVGVAIRKDGEIYQLPKPCRHGDVIFWMVGRGLSSIGGEQGFIISDGLFANRQEAAVLALGSGQIKEFKYNANTLFSEDLW